MSDSFADLWSSTTPQQQQQQRQSSNVPLGSLQNSRLSNNQLAKPYTDAFSSLNSFTSTANSNAHMTMAERAAQVEKERLEKLHGIKRNNKVPTNDLGSAWDGLDALAAPQSTSLPGSGNNSKATSLDAFDLFAFDHAQTSQPLQPQSTSVLDDSEDWGLSSFAPAKATTSKPQLHSSNSLFDMMDSSQAQDIHAHHDYPKHQLERTDSPSEDFDFGSREYKEDSLLEQDDLGSHQDTHGDDDILGLLSIPVEVVSKPKIPESAQESIASTSQSPATSRPVSTKPPSPPPHVLGQLVEMGFAPAKARAALVATYSQQTTTSHDGQKGRRDEGWDVERALDTLVNGVTADYGRHTADPALGRRAGANASRSGSGRNTPRQDADPRTRLRPPPRNPASSSSLPHGTSVSASSSSSDLLAQASEIGLSMFNKANAFWNTKGKEMKEKVVERVVKVYEETTSSLTEQGGGGRNRGDVGKSRPKWMQGEYMEREAGQRYADGVAFEDDSEHGSASALGAEAERTRWQAPKDNRPDVKMQERQADKSDLSSMDTPTVYVSPFRRGKPKPQTPTPTESTSTPQGPVSARVPTPASASPPPRSLIISCSTTTLATSAQHKATGTQYFKLGQYAEAHVAYTRAIEVLPKCHLSRVPLYNNRSLVRSRMGDIKGAVADARRVVRIICTPSEGADDDELGLDSLGGGGTTHGQDQDKKGPVYDPRKEARVERPEEGSDVDLGAAWVKAVKRCAESYEAMEKWKEAEAEWEVLLESGDWSGEATRHEALAGIGRCKKIMQGSRFRNGVPEERKPASKPAPHRRAPPISQPSADVPSVAVNALRQANNIAESEATQRHELKDVVDARLAAWKGGKESNIRALIASLDTVLWPELGWVKVGMGDLVTEHQVKVRYVKAIAKVHPDKLNAKNTSVEQRMIANGVFGALNEAWNAFKP